MVAAEAPDAFKKARTACPASPEPPDAEIACAGRALDVWPRTMAKFGIVVLHAEPSHEAVWEAVQLLMLRHEHLALADHMIQSRAVVARLRTAQVRCCW